MKKILTALTVASVVTGGSILAMAENTDTMRNDPAANSARDMKADPSAPAARDMKADPSRDDGRNAADTMADDKADKNPEAYPADNSGRNQRDADGSTATSGDQSNNKVDLEITQKVRQAVTDDDSLSVNAQNVKIITNGGVVTLRGPVKSDAEKQSIAAKAKAVSGVTRVDNQLEIETR